ncbi:MAG: cell division protein FtsZ [Alphaproteobacteria bacterium]|nr:MAG: cell division protein FtsZ [Alphaproteobacteria bacterium]
MHAGSAPAEGPPRPTVVPAPAAGPRIVVIGVGGAGGNAVNNMIREDLPGVEFIVANTDAQALSQSLCQTRVQMGIGVTQGLGAGSRPDIGRAAAEESLNAILEHVTGANMLFLTAGMGGGTGTGAAPVIARAAREAGVLTIGVVSKPFHFEGVRRMNLAEAGIDELAQHVDTLIVIPNQNLFRVANEKTTFAEAFRLADQVLYSGVRGVTDLMVTPGLINLDFADVRSVMAEMGKAIMGAGEASGENRALAAAEAAIANPLLDEVSMKGARGVLINITGGMDLTLFEVDQAANRIREEVDSEANIIFGSTFDETMEGRMRVSIVAAGIEAGDEDRRGAAAKRPIVSLYSDRVEARLRETTPEGGKSGGDGDDHDAPGATQGAGAHASPPDPAPHESTGTGEDTGQVDADATDTGDGANMGEAPSSSSQTPSVVDLHPRMRGAGGSGDAATSSSSPSQSDQDDGDQGAGTSAPAATDFGEWSKLLREADARAEASADAGTSPRGASAEEDAACTAREASDDDAPGTEEEEASADPAPLPRRRRANPFLSWIAGGGGASAEDLFRKGDRYYHGQGVRKNLALALRAYLKAAEMGHAAAQNRVGWMYEKGEGVTPDHAEAVKWYRRAAGQGYVNAMNDLGYMYRQGWGVPRDYGRALHWFLKAAEKYDSYAEYNLGQMYENGWGAEKDLDEAIRWFRRSAARGHEWAAKRLEELGVHT